MKCIFPCLYNEQPWDDDAHDDAPCEGVGVEPKIDAASDNEI